MAPTGDPACNPGMCPDWESNWRPFILQPTLNPLSYTSQAWASFHMSLSPLYVLLGEVSVQIFCPFFNWFVCLSGVESCEYFVYFGDQTLVSGIIGKYVFLYSWFSFILMLFSLAMQKLFNLMRSHLFILSFMSLALGMCLWGCCCVECLRFSCQCFPLELL